MTQSHTNDTNQIQEPQSTSQVPVNSEDAIRRGEVIADEQIKEQTASSAKSTAEPTIDEEMVDDAPPDEDVDASEEDDESTAPPGASASNDSIATQTSSTPTANANQDEDERNEIESQPYDFDQCTVQIAVQLLPDDGNPNGRMVVVGVRSHLDAPILRFVRLNELGELPPLVHSLLDELKSELPAREQAASAAFEKKKEEKAKRTAELEASRARASQRGKKTAKAISLSTAPTANAAATDNRPRPEVSVPKTTQQQMGLL